MIARIVLFGKILVILAIRGEYLTPEDLTDLRGFILVILVIRGGFVPAYLGDLLGSFSLDTRDTWRFSSRGSHGFARIYPCDSWRHDFTRIYESHK